MCFVLFTVHTTADASPDVWFTNQQVHLYKGITASALLLGRWCNEQKWFKSKGHYTFWLSNE